MSFLQIIMKKYLLNHLNKDEQECHKMFLNMYNIHKIMLNILKKIKLNDFENHNYQNGEEF